MGVGIRSRGCICIFSHHHRLFDQPASSKTMAAPEIILGAKYLIAALTRVIELDAGVTAPWSWLHFGPFSLKRYLHWLNLQPSQARVLSKRRRFARRSQSWTLVTIFQASAYNHSLQCLFMIWTWGSWSEVDSIAISLQNGTKRETAATTIPK